MERPQVVPDKNLSWPHPVKSNIINKQEREKIKMKPRRMSEQRDVRKMNK